ncbi:MAG: RagB/SusD family nutrient uptake outer membrane protein [Tannerella sp.]|jgi:hypothetical protein|nr:RagB/SusD family nutrient uptake outer membrane protein [Tannerella sp.]
MKKIFHIIVAAVFFTACQDVLDKKPLDIISDAVVWNDPVLIEAYIAQQYEFTPILVQDAMECIRWWRLSAVSAAPDFNTAMYMSDKLGGQLATSVLAEGKAGFCPSGAEAYKISGLQIGGAPPLEYWELPYKTIRNLNEFIERVPNSPMDPAIAKLRIAEARFLRAFNYFAMVRRYGGVPLVTKVAKLDDPYEILYPKRDSEKAIYDFIISEMDDIAEVLSETVDYGRPTKEAVLAMKSRVALYAGSIAQFGTVQLDGLLGFPSGEAHSYYRKAYDAANEIIKGGKHYLYDVNPDKVQNFKDLFIVKRNPEMIFVKQHEWTDFYNGGNGWSWNFLQSPQPGGVWGIGNGLAPYLETVEAFEYVDGRSGKLDRQAIQQGEWYLDDIFGEKDPRFYASVWMQDTPWKISPTGKVEFHFGLLEDGKIIDDPNGSSKDGKVRARGYQNYQNTGFGVMKLIDESRPASADQGQDGQDYPVFRYGEILLNFAEAAFELGETGEAFRAVNEIRKRAGIFELNSITREQIRHEREVELAFEGHRYWDLRRWRIAEDVLTRHYSGLKYILDYESVKNNYDDDPSTPTTTPKYRLVVVEKIDGEPGIHFPAHNYYFPINLSRTAANPNLIENPGYQ